MPTASKPDPRVPGPWRQLAPYRAKIVLGIVCLLAISALGQSIPYLLKLAIDVAA